MKNCQEEKKKDDIHKVCYFVFANCSSHLVTLDSIQHLNPNIHDSKQLE